MRLSNSLIIKSKSYQGNLQRIGICPFAFWYSSGQMNSHIYANLPCAHLKTIWKRDKWNNIWLEENQSYINQVNLPLYYFQNVPWNIFICMRCNITALKFWELLIPDWQILWGVKFYLWKKEHLVLSACFLGLIWGLLLVYTFVGFLFALAVEGMINLDRKSYGK